MTKESSNFVGGNLKVTRHPAKFGGDRHCGSGDIIILFYHEILQDHVIKTCDSMGRRPSRQVTILISLVSIGTLVGEI